MKIQVFKNRDGDQLVQEIQSIEDYIIESVHAQPNELALDSFESDDYVV